MGGPLPARKTNFPAVNAPPLELFHETTGGSKGREASTTAAWVAILKALLKHPELGKYIVPIVPDEARTFGMESLFREYGIYASQGQRYRPVDANVLLYYKEAKDGQILEEGITEMGSMASLPRRRHRLRQLRRADDSFLHLLFDVRLPARRRYGVGRRRFPRQRIPDGRNRRTHALCSAKACSTRTDIRPCCSAPSPPARFTIPPTPMSSPSSSRTASAACIRSARIASTTSPSTTKITPSRPCPKAIIFAKAFCAASINTRPPRADTPPRNYSAAAPC